MTQIDRYILKQIFVPSALAFFLIGFLAISNELRERAELLLNEVLRLSDLVRLAIYFLPTLISFVVPIAFFFGVLMGLGRLVEHGEVGAMKSAGVSLRRLIAPVVIAGTVLAFACVLVQDRLQPWGIHRAYALIKEELPKRATIDVLQPGIWHEYEGWRVYIGSRDRASRTLYDVEIVQPGKEGGNWIFHADTARMAERSGERVLELGKGYFVDPESHRATFDSQELIVPARIEISSARRLRLGMTLSELLDSEKQLSHDYENSGSYASQVELLKERQEIADRLSLPFAALAVGFAGAPLALGGRHGRRGSRMQLFSSGLGILITYYVLRVTLEPRSLHDLDDYLVRVWIPNAALIAFGAVLVWRLDRVIPARQRG